MHYKPNVPLSQVNFDKWVKYFYITSIFRLSAQSYHRWFPHIHSTVLPLNRQYNTQHKLTINEKWEWKTWRQNVIIFQNQKEIHVAWIFISGCWGGCFFLFSSLHSRRINNHNKIELNKHCLEQWWYIDQRVYWYKLWRQAGFVGKRCERPSQLSKSSKQERNTGCSREKERGSENTSFTTNEEWNTRYECDGMIWFV